MEEVEPDSCDEADSVMPELCTSQNATCSQAAFQQQLESLKTRLKKEKEDAYVQRIDRLRLEKNEKQQVKKSRQVPVAAVKNPRTAVKKLRQEPVAQVTNLRTAVKKLIQQPVAQVTNRRTAVKKSRQVQVAEVTNLRTAVKKSRQEPVTEVTNPKTAVKRSLQEQIAEVTNPRTAVKRSRQEQVAQVTNPRTAVKRSRQEQVAQVTNPRTAVNKSRQEPVAKVTNPKTVVKKSRQKQVVEVTNPGQKMAAKKASGSDRQHEYFMKLKADKVLWQAHQLKERERWKQRQAAKENQPKDVQMRRATRKKWREAQQKCREKKAEEKRRLQDVFTQPQMPIPGIDSVSFSSAITCTTERGRKKVRCAAYRKIKQLKQQLEKEQRRAENSRKDPFEPHRAMLAYQRQKQMFAHYLKKVLKRRRAQHARHYFYPQSSVQLSGIHLHHQVPFARNVSFGHCWPIG